jgi:hypothetical protein
MKATIDVPDELYRRVKAEAAMRGLTVREVTMDLYQRWLRERQDAEMTERPSEWLQSWLSAADQATARAPEGPSAREQLAADRRRFERP